jgi:C-terminal processing protease CtpA/Prc
VGGTDQLNDDGKDAVFVSEGEGSGAAGAAGLEVDDELVAVDGHQLANLVHDQVIALLRGANQPVVLTVRREHDELAADEGGGGGDTPVGEGEVDETVRSGYTTTIYESLFEVEYVLPQTGDLGFSFAGGSDRPVQPGDPSIYVTHVVSTGPAASLLRVEDRIVRMNGEQMERDVTYDEAMRAARLGGGETLHIVAARQAEPVEELLDVTIDVTEAGSLGITFRGGTDSSGAQAAEAGGDDDVAIYVTGVDDAGASAGYLYEGDRIATVNGHSLEGVTHAEASDSSSPFLSHFSWAFATFRGGANTTFSVLLSTSLAAPMRLCF